MPLSGSDQQHVQDIIDSATPAQRADLKADAERTLSEVNSLMRAKVLSNQESRAAEAAIEFLVRLEAIEQRKGWLFRAKRRVQLCQMYLGI